MLGVITRELLELEELDPYELVECLDFELIFRLRSDMSGKKQTKKRNMNERMNERMNGLMNI